MNESSAVLDDGVARAQRELLDRLVDLEHRKAALEAEQLQALAALAAMSAVDPGDRLGERVERDWIREEVACALRIAGPTAAARLELARELTARLPATLSALAGGRLSAPMARRLAETLAPLDDATATRVEARVLPRAAGQTFAQFGQSLRRAVLQLDARAQEAKHRAAVAQRRVCRRPADDGMAELWAILPADAVARCWQALDAAAAAAGPDADTDTDTDRNADQARADALVALLTGTDAAPEHRDGGARAADRTPRRRRARTPGPAVHVTVALSTLLGLDDQPGELAGHGPVPAALARRIAADPSGTWRRLVTDPLGGLIDYGRTRYRPPAALVNHVRARDRTCRFPTCNRRAGLCETDHVLAWDDDGGTDEANLQALCPRHHHAKHDAGWRTVRHCDGSTGWLSPAGRHYEKPPDHLPVDTTRRRE